MKLLMHENFLEQLLKMPNNIGRKVLDFQKKFRQNSQAPAIHLEPISTFKDPQFRTARLDLKYRLILWAPKTGDVYHLVWMDTHDEAMAWAKNRVMEWNEATQTMQLYLAPEIVEVPGSTKEPVVRSLFQEYSDSKLSQLGVPPALMEIVRSMEDTADLEAAESQLPSEVFERLYYVSEGIRIDQLIAEVNEGKSKSTNVEEQMSSINNQRSFVEVNDALMEEILHGDIDRWQVFLHPSQRLLVESQYNGSIKVTGGAGTGKTVVALHRLKQLAEVADGDTRKILFTTYTNALTKNLQHLAEKLHIDPYKIQLINIDAIAKELALQAGLIDQNTRILDLHFGKSSKELWEQILEQHSTEFDEPFLNAEYQQVVLHHDIQQPEVYLNTSRTGRSKPLSRKQKMEVWQLVQYYEALKKTHNLVDRSELFNRITGYYADRTRKPYKHIIADEIQDLSTVELRFLRSLVEKKANDLFLVGDPYQKIYARRVNFTQAGIQVRGTRSRQLRINYRTSEEIKRLAISTVKGLKYDDFDGEEENLKGYLSLFHGEKPAYQLFRTAEEEIEYLLNQIQELNQKGLAYRDIAVGFRTKEAIRPLRNKLHTLQIPYSDITTTPFTHSDTITLSTLHSLKGLEFKAVFLAGINQRTCPYQFYGYDKLEPHEKQEYENSEKSLIYVAMTRAVNQLQITGTGVKSELIGV